MGIALAMSLPRPALAATARVATGLPDFGAVVRDHTDLVYGVALRILGDREAAAEVTNTTFLKAYRAFDRYDPARPLRAWLVTIAANEAVSAGRGLSRERARRAPVEEADALADRVPAPDEELVAREERARVRHAVAALPELYRVPIVLRYFSDLSVEEVAAAVGRPPTTVGVQLLRGRALLRDSLAQGGRP